MCYDSGGQIFNLPGKGFSTGQNSVQTECPPLHFFFLQYKMLTVMYMFAYTVAKPDQLHQELNSLNIVTLCYFEKKVNIQDNCSFKRSPALVVVGGKVVVIGVVVILNRLSENTIMQTFLTYVCKLETLRYRLWHITGVVLFSLF